MSRQALARVPASAANLGAGFDCVGAAVDLWLSVSATLDETLRSPTLERGGTLAHLTTPATQDHIWTGFATICRRAGRTVPMGVRLRATSDIPLSRGLGSSAAAIVAGAAAANGLLDLRLNDDELALVCAGIEGHADNVTAAVYGGARLVIYTAGRPLVGSPLEVHPSLALAFAIPAVRTSTKQARAVLPPTLPHAQAARAAALAAALVRGIETGSKELLALSLEDVLHVPFRRAKVPGYDAVVHAAEDACAIGATLSGSGPTIVAFAPAAAAAGVADAMCRQWRTAGVDAKPFVNPPSVRGHHVTTRIVCDE
jgi:homoserine kinase